MFQYGRKKNWVAGLGYGLKNSPMLPLIALHHDWVVITPVKQLMFMVFEHFKGMMDSTQ
jgi:hypothetical protein